MGHFNWPLTAIYEAARLSSVQPRYFSVKSVVDDGGENKGDSYHRLACAISARVVCKIVEDLLE